MYNVAVVLKHDVTAEQKAAIESAAHALHPVDGIRFETREQAWQNYKEIFKDQPDMVAQVSPDALPESFRLTTQAKEFDCAPVGAIRELPGVEQVTVVQQSTNGHAGAPVRCP